MGIVISLDDYRRRKGLPLPRISTTATTAGKQHQARKRREQQQPTTATRPTAPARSRRAARSAVVVTDVDPGAAVREALVMPERRPAARREAVSV
ncbi:hypothetical protein [Streptomyces sp. NPDC001508]|uniref:hypothetical protein n=1 Tax=Streptomyces sp. NPDC001508 TaxID=3154656 RepID=UPI00332DE13A